MSAIPIPDPDLQKQRRLIELAGDIPSPINTVDGQCTFIGRCPYAKDNCAAKVMELHQVEDGHWTVCDCVLKKERKV